MTAGAAVLRLRDRRLDLAPGCPLLMGVVNASPESFYDGRRARRLDELVAHARSLADAGAALVDVGGESGVTDRAPVSAEEEARRVVPLVERLAGDGLAVSVDTWKPEVAERALAAGAVMVNDPSGLSDRRLAAACAAVGAGLVLTHTRVAPKVKAFPPYRDVVADVRRFLDDRLDAARTAGVEEERLVLDPGPDLGKTPAESVAVLRGLGALHDFGRPVLLAVARKDFVGALTRRSPADRLAGTLAAVAFGVEAGATLVRTHDPAAVGDFLAVSDCLRGRREVPTDLRLEKALRREERVA